MRARVPGREGTCVRVLGGIGVRKVRKGAKCTVTGVTREVTWRSVRQAGTDHRGHYRPQEHLGFYFKDNGRQGPLVQTGPFCDLEQVTLLSSKKKHEVSDEFSTRLEQPFTVPLRGEQGCRRLRGAETPAWERRGGEGQGDCGSGV